VILFNHVIEILALAISPSTEKSESERLRFTLHLLCSG
jgi:hypothetical protein